MLNRHKTKTRHEQVLYELEVSKLYIDYAKYTSTLFSTFLAGQVTLLGTVFAGIENKEFAIIAIVFMIIAVMLAYSFAEPELRRLRESEIDVDFPKYARLKKRLPSHTSIQIVKSILTALFVLASLGCYLYFLYQGKIISLE